MSNCWRTTGKENVFRLQEHEEILNQLDCTSVPAEPHGFRCIQYCLACLHLPAFPFTISIFLFTSKTTMTLKVQDMPRASAFGYPARIKYSDHLMSVIYLLLPCGTLNGGIRKEVIYKHLFPDFHSAEKCVFFSPSYKSSRTHSITELRKLQTVSIESTCTGLHRKKEQLSPIVLFLLSSLSSVLFGMAGVGGADAAGGRGARLFFFCKSFRDAPCEI